MRKASLALIGFAFAALAAAGEAKSMFKLPEEIGRIEGPRDCNILQLEPTVLNERYYTSGRSERSQFCGNVLPEGAVIPDSDFPVKIEVKSSLPAAPTMQPASNLKSGQKQ